MAVTAIDGAKQIRDATVTPAKVTSGIIKADGTNAFTGNQDFGGFIASGLGDPSNPQDAVNLRYLQSLAQGFDTKPFANCATAAPLPANTYGNGASGVGATLTATSMGVLTVDGHVVALNEYVAVKNEAAGANNGLYKCTTAGGGAAAYVLTRAVEMDLAPEYQGALIYVLTGTVNGGTQWVCNNTSPPVVGTTAINFVELAGPGSYTGSGGVVVTGTIINLTYGTTASTVCQGNDARLSDPRTPVGTALTAASIWVGSAGNTAAAVVMSGDVTITNAGVTAIGTNKVTFAKFQQLPTVSLVGNNTGGTANAVSITLAASLGFTGTVLGAVFGSTATTVCVGNDSRLSDARTPVGTPLTSALIWVGSSGNTAAPVAMSGDATMTNAGVVTVANQVRLSKFITRETPTGAVNGSNVTFALANTPVSGTESVYLNGILQDPGAGNDYTIAGPTITYLTAPLAGDKIRVTYISS